MVKVIKHGDKPKEVGCKHCGAVLSYLRGDVTKEAISSMIGTQFVDMCYAYIICPDCKNKVEVKS